jgi:tetratricopeptide (TPR) repeat protein
MLAIVAPPELQLDWNMRALALAEQSPQARARTWLGSLLNNLGWTYHAAGRHVQALDMFHRALREREATGSATQIRIARWCIARGQRALGRFEAALEIQQLLLAELERDGAVDGYVFEELAENLLALGKQDAAQAYFARAYAALAPDRWLAESDPARIERLRRLGRVRSDG